MNDILSVGRMSLDSVPEAGDNPAADQAELNERLDEIEEKFNQIVGLSRMTCQH